MSLLCQHCIDQQDCRVVLAEEMNAVMLCCLMRASTACVVLLSSCVTSVPGNQRYIFSMHGMLKESYRSD